MNHDRRKTLAILGGGLIMAAGGGLGGFAATRDPSKARAPWQQAGSYDDPRKQALSYAILAPNPHNLQPWLVGLDTADTVVLHRDPSLGLPHTDPFDRQITIGLGCFLEQLAIAATLTGHRVETELFPAGESGPVAASRFFPGASVDPLARQILGRRSCKQAFAERPVESKSLDSLRDYAAVVERRESVEALRNLTWDAFQVEMQTPRTAHESAELMRIGKAEIEASPDGIDVGGGMLETLMLLGALSRDAITDPHSEATKTFLDGYRNMLMSTPAYAVILTPANGRRSQIEAGGAWLRLNLKTTELGLALHPVSQALQEYPEMASNYRRVHQMLASNGETVQMLGRLGYGPEVKPAPRWPLEAKIIDG